MATVFVFWDATPEAPPRQAELVAIWYKQTLAQGNTPRLLTARDALKSRGYRAAVKCDNAHQVPIEVWAMRAKRVQWMASLRDFELFL